MKKINKMYAAALLLTLCCASCNDDDALSYSQKPMTNSELKAILIQKGYQFSEDGKLLLDDLANRTTTLDLTATKLTDLSELSILPNLKEVDLSDNGYGPAFDFAKLPEQITGVDLTGNEIYEYPGLVHIETQENGDETVTVLHKLTKLYLPEEAKYNCVELPAFFSHEEGVDMKMENAKGNVEAYHTLREVPDATARKMLQKLYPSLFNEDKIDISRRMVDPSQKNKEMNISPFSVPKGESVKSVEGVEYVIMNPSYQGATIMLQPSEECTLPYLKLNPDNVGLFLSNINTPNLDISYAERLCLFKTRKNKGIKNIDFSHCTLMGQRSFEAETDVFNNPSQISFLECENLETVTWPKAAKILDDVTFEMLPKLKDLDLSQFEFISMSLAGLNCGIKYPNYKWDIYYEKVNFTPFAISEDIYNKEETKVFLDANHEYLKEFRPEVGKIYRWSKHYK